MKQMHPFFWRADMKKYSPKRILLSTCLLTISFLPVQYAFCSVYPFFTFKNNTNQTILLEVPGSPKNCYSIASGGSLDAKTQDLVIGSNQPYNVYLQGQMGSGCNAINSSSYCTSFEVIGSANFSSVTVNPITLNRPQSCYPLPENTQIRSTLGQPTAQTKGMQPLTISLPSQ
jgi:hypothetical protein